MKTSHEKIPDNILEKSNLSLNEQELIRYIREHREELNQTLNLLKDGEIIAEKK